MKRKKIKPRRRKKALLQPLTFSKKPWRKIGLYVLLGIICFPFIILFSIKTGIVGNMPDKDQLRSIRNFEASEVYSADHQLLGRYYIQNRIVLDYEHISSHIKDALVATEDERFYQHHGIDFKSLPRVFLKPSYWAIEAGEVDPPLHSSWPKIFIIASNMLFFPC